MAFVKALSPKEPRASRDDGLWWWNVPSFGMNLACALTQGTAHLYQKHNALWIPPHFAMLCVVVSLASLWLHNDHNGSYIGVTVVHSPLRLGSLSAQLARCSLTTWLFSQLLLHSASPHLAQGRVIIGLNAQTFSATWPLTGRPFRASRMSITYLWTNKQYK